MPVFAMIYVLLVAYLALDSLYRQIKDRTSVWYAMLNFIALVILIVMFSAYWMPSFLQRIRFLAPVLFLFSLIWELSTARTAIEGMVRDISSELRPLVRKWMIGFEIITAFIGYWFGGAAVLRVL